MALTQIPSGMIAPAQTLTLNGITFPATQVPSADANTLDDYEEGTFTPTKGVAMSGTGITLSGKYTKTGNIVNYQILVIGTSLATSAGGIVVQGLPFSASSSVGGIAIGAYGDESNTNWRGTYTYLTSLYNIGSSTSGSNQFYFSGTYFTNT